jgi:CheY-like chemotaxis protein
MLGGFPIISKVVCCCNGKLVLDPVERNKAHPGSSRNNECKRILVVDDEEISREINSFALIEAACQVDTLEDGLVAWEALRSASYDLLLTSNNMPKMSGTELIEKRWAARVVLPVVMVTEISPKEFFTLRYSLSASFNC